MELTPHFNSSEFLVSESYPDLVPTDVSELDLYKFYLLARTLLEAVRDLTGTPVRILSGKRSDALNKAVRGATNSDHLYRWDSAACDFTCSDQVEHAFHLLKVYDNNFGQLIWYPEQNFIHVSLPSQKHKGQVLVKPKNGPYTPWRDFKGHA